MVRGKYVFAGAVRGESGIRESIEHVILVCKLYEGEGVSFFQCVGSEHTMKFVQSGSEMSVLLGFSDEKIWEVEVVEQVKFFLVKS